MHVLNMDKDSNNAISVCASVSVSQKLRYQTVLNTVSVFLLKSFILLMS